MTLEDSLADPSIEIRSCPGELRALFDESTGIRTLIGYAAVWGAVSSLALRDPKGQPYFERIARGAFLASLDSPEIGCFFDHDTSKVLGRTGAGTLIVSEDDHGLRFQTTLPATSFASDLVVMIERGDVWGCSFGFYLRKDSWSKDGQGRLIRTINEAKLFDVSPVGRPTYRETGVALRSLGRWEAEGQSSTDAEIALLASRVRLSAMVGR